MIYFVYFPCYLCYNNNMSLSSGIKFRAYPTELQQEELSKWIGCQRFIYNAKVTENRYFCTFRRHALSLTGYPVPSDQQYSQFKDKTLTPFLYEVPSQVLRNGSVRFMGAQQRFFKGLAQRPNVKKKNGRQTVWLTNELFWFEPTGKTQNKNAQTIYEHRLMIGTKKHPLGELCFKAHREYDLPATIVITRHAGRWFVSFSYEIQDLGLSEEELIAHYSAMSVDHLDKITMGSDLGVVVNVALSDGTRHDFIEGQKKNLLKKEWRRKRYQKQMSRCTKKSGRWKKKVEKVARCHQHAAHVREDFAHKTSRTIVDSDAEIFVFEDLKTRNMTKAPKPNKSANGKYLPNGAAAKAGLNRAILESAWGKIKQFVSYKARRANKLVIMVPPQGTSQECSKCSHTHPDNRRSQALFVCQQCGFTGNADINAANIIKKRGIKLLVEGEILVKQTKRAMRLRKKKHLGPEQPEVTRGEMELDELRTTVCSAHPSSNRETPTTIAQTV